ncbi:hypothetical protein K7X08_007362 [Anisodus acutangulus]|uniref:BZIP domain-containing protein n=1 Tax=Anisodus acutangulus TaxID=402998 RepID=A0A9Q1LDX1_9SOLA|nr:hypothetical protein K7X08_007362 [Anisodus acutangulus]
MMPLFITGARITIKSEDEQEIAIQAEDESELQTSFVCALNYPPVTSSKSRQELTEAEKEGRRLHRVLANRESARRTIHRRQNKELAAAEYNSLKNNNNNLRVQMAKIVKAEVEETDDDSKSIPVEAPNSTTSPTFLHNQSSKVPLFLSTVFQPLDGLVSQIGSQSISGITPQLPKSLGEFKPSDRLDSSMMMNHPTTPLYVVSFPWPMQFHTQSNPFHPRPSYPSDERKTSLVHECSVGVKEE